MSNMSKEGTVDYPNGKIYSIKNTENHNSVCSSYKWSVEHAAKQTVLVKKF